MQVEERLGKDSSPQTVDLAQLSVERLQECRVVLQALAGIPEFGTEYEDIKFKEWRHELTSCGLDLVQKACKQGDGDDKLVGKLDELSQRLYSEHYLTNNGCNGFAQDFRSVMTELTSSTDQALVKAATTVRDTFEQLFAYVEVHPAEAGVESGRLSTEIVCRLLTEDNRVFAVL